MALREFDYEKEPTVSIVKKILTDAIKMNATDIHFDPLSDELLIRFRINGELSEYTTAPENVKINIITRVKILAGMNITNQLLPQTGAISFELDSKPHNMRVSSLPVVEGEKIVVHISNYAKNLKSISKIGFNEEDIIKIKDLLKEKQGIILVTGTANSGKTTTTYAILKELNSKMNNIISIEDPIKMKITGINQVQIAPEKGLTYRNVIRSVLLQDPNIIAINELVDDETTSLALRASLTGRLVISTMNTKTIYSTIDTLLNMDVENYLLGSNLIGIISERLVKKLCPTCREKRAISTYEKNIIKEILDEDIDEIYYPKGCEECKDGYIDLVPVVEVIKIDDELRSAISNNKNRKLIRNIIYSSNDSILKDAFNKVILGETSFQEAIRIIDLKEDIFEENQKLKNLILGKNQSNNDNQEIISQKIKVTSINEDDNSSEVNDEAQNENITKSDKENIKENTTKKKEPETKEQQNPKEKKVLKPKNENEQDIKEVTIDNKEESEEIETTNEQEQENENEEQEKTENKIIIEKVITDEEAKIKEINDNDDLSKNDNTKDTKKPEKVITQETNNKNITDPSIQEEPEKTKEAEEKELVVQKEKQKPTIKLNFKNTTDDDDDDDDNFNYDKSYINNF